MVNQLITIYAQDLHGKSSQAHRIANSSYSDATPCTPGMQQHPNPTIETMCQPPRGCTPGVHANQAHVWLHKIPSAFVLCGFCWAYPTTYKNIVGVNTDPILTHPAKVKLTTPYDLFEDFRLRFFLDLAAFQFVLQSIALTADLHNMSMVQKAV